MITASNAGLVRASVVLPGVNIAVTDEAEASLHERGVVCLPDFIANAGGAFCAAVEYRGRSRTQAFAEIAERIRSSTAELMDRITASGDLPRVEAERMARTRIKDAGGVRRRFWHFLALHDARMRPQQCEGPLWRQPVVRLDARVI